ncbi:phospholipase A and acyltransferase 4-like [Aulostomus maculatus]
MAPTLFETPQKPGDLIEISRGTFKHWAVYVGENEVVHLLPPIPDNDSAALSNLLSLMDSSHAVVRQDKIWEVVGSHSFKVNNLLDDNYEPRDSQVIVRDARRMVGQVLPYSIITDNSEHFATKLRYGKAESRQVQTAAVAGAVGLAGIAVLAVGASLLSSLFQDNDKRRHRK